MLSHPGLPQAGGRGILFSGNLVEPGGIRVVCAGITSLQYDAPKKAMYAPERGGYSLPLLNGP